MIGFDGTMNDEAGAGTPAAVPRRAKRVVADLRERGPAASRSSRTRTRSGHCERCGTVVEPLISLQWFCQHGRAGRAGDRRGPRGPRHASCRSAPSAIYFALDGEHPRLVHLPPALVGPPHPGLVLRRRRHDRRASDEPTRCPTCGATELRAGPGRARHLVLVGAVAVRHARLARADPTTCAPSTRPGQLSTAPRDHQPLGAPG